MTHKTLYQEVRAEQNIFSAWRHVKRSALSSKDVKIKSAAAEFEHQHQKYLRKIIIELRTECFVFDKNIGVLKDKKKRERQGKKPRPISIGTIRNRVVERAILQILQPRKVTNPRDPYSKSEIKHDPRLGNLNDVSRSRFGVGGLMAPYGGVQPAIKLAMKAMGGGATDYYQSDIASFFTDIPVEPVLSIIKQETKDEKLLKLISDALNISLSNAGELGADAALFPSNGVGVAQGSSLSAFAGNVLLFDLDHQINNLDVTAIRYIDDLLIISKSATSLKQAIKVAEEGLKAFGFSLYSPDKDPNKASKGKCENGLNFLGCRIEPGKCVPTDKNITDLTKEINSILKESKSAISTFVKSSSLRPYSIDKGKAHGATIDKIGKKLYGWQKSFGFCTDPQSFKTVDRKIQKHITEYDHWVRRKLKNQSKEAQMSILGIPSTEHLFLNQSK
ncbi:reverse transcriptase domain-containing protein [Hyphococcus sp. DH-69]|uniref:reverse transcriptase domain-containing protein n=1 Tax=Hyphococcus formosus TaxID=3143534 RepID=UPI00398B4428